MLDSKVNASFLEGLVYRSILIIFKVYQIIEQLNEYQISQLLELYKNEFWSKNRTCEDIMKMLSASDIVFGLVDETEALIY